MRILVTGGMGFIGSNFIRYLLRKYDYTIINYDALTYAGNPENLKDIISERYAFYYGRVECIEELMKAARDVDAIVHFAAETHVDRSIEDPSLFLKTNVLGTYSVLEVARKLRIKKVVHVSTDEVYGSLPDGEYAHEDSPFSPSSPYAASKASADLLAFSFFNTYFLPVSIVRPSNNFGPFQYPEKFIPLAITNIIEGLPIPVYGDGRNIRDWLYVEDCCEAIDLVLHRGSPGEAYNIGAGYELRNIDVVRRIVNILGKGDDFIKFVEDRPAHDYRYSMDCRKIRALGWSPRLNFERGLEKTVSWYVDNYGWWKAIKGRMAREKAGYWSLSRS